MRRSTAFSALLTSYKKGFAGAIALAAALACGEYGTSVAPAPDGVTRVHVASVDAVLPDSLKNAPPGDVNGNIMAPVGPVATVLSAPFSPVATVADACGGGGAAPTYTESLVDFNPEAIPNIAAIATDLKDDGMFPLSIGFNFTFFGNTYNSLNVFSNGFLVFGPASVNVSANGEFIPAAKTPNNMIALAWADWSPQNVPDGIRWETRGTAPHRKFILQFNNVPEYMNTGVLLSQVVLTEGTNDITIYTNNMATKNSGHVITQGIENATGTYALYDAYLNTTLNRQLPRVKNFFKLQTDAIRFTPVSTKDETAPTFDPLPVNLTQFNDPGLATAVVAVAPPSAKDNCSTPTVTGVRSDGVPSLDAPYPVGVTTITWTAKDADGNTSTATQTVTVVDNEKPVWLSETVSLIEVNATSPNGAVVYYNLHVKDNVGVTSVSCQPPSGSVFPIGGDMSVKCTASDAAGNTSDQFLSVSVFSAHDQIWNLMVEVQALNLPNGTEQPIYNQLSTAYDQTADGSSACKKVSDFVSMVQKKSSNIPSHQVAYLIAEGNRILSVMGCSPPSASSLLTTFRFQRTP